MSSLLPWFSPDGKTAWWNPAKNHVVPKQCYSTVPQCEDGIEVSNLFPLASYSPCISAIWALSRVVAVPHGYLSALKWDNDHQKIVKKESLEAWIPVPCFVKKQTLIKVREKQSNHSHWYHFHHCQRRKQLWNPQAAWWCSHSSWSVFLAWHLASAVEDVA